MSRPSTSVIPIGPPQVGPMPGQHIPAAAVVSIDQEMDESTAVDDDGSDIDDDDDDAGDDLGES